MKQNYRENALHPYLSIGISVNSGFTSFPFKNKYLFPSHHQVLKAKNKQLTMSYPSDQVGIFKRLSH